VTSRAPYGRELADLSRLDRWWSRVARTARERGGAVLVVDGSAPVEAIAELVGRHFGLIAPITA
jgi:hypothetical protein